MNSIQLAANTLTLTSHDIYLIRMALNLTSNMPAGDSDYIARLNEEMKELVERVDRFTDNQDYRRPGVYKVTQ